MKAILTLFRTAAAVSNENCKSISDTAHYVCFAQEPYSVCDFKNDEASYHSSKLR